MTGRLSAKTWYWTKESIIRCFGLFGEGKRRRTAKESFGSAEQSFKSPQSFWEAFLEKRLLTIGQIEAGLPEEREERLLERRGELAKEKELLTEYLEILS